MKRKNNVIIPLFVSLFILVSCANNTEIDKNVIKNLELNITNNLTKINELKINRGASFLQDKADEIVEDFNILNKHLEENEKLTAMLRDVLIKYEFEYFDSSLIEKLAFLRKSEKQVIINNLESSMLQNLVYKFFENSFVFDEISILPIIDENYKSQDSIRYQILIIANNNLIMPLVLVGNDTLKMLNNEFKITIKKKEKKVGNVIVGTGRELMKIPFILYEKETH